MIPKPSSCAGCPLEKYPHPNGFIPSTGTGANGVLIVGEAGGEHEAKEGMGFVGKSGHFLFSNLQRVGIEREGFRLANVVACQPYKNILSKTSFEKEATAHCSPNLDGAILAHKQVCKANGKTPVIWTLGRTAFKRIMGLDEKSPILRKSYLNYPFFSEVYGCWVLASDHPSFLMRGNTHLIPVLQFGAKRALEIADSGVPPQKVEYLLDPNPSTFQTWVQDYLKVGADVVLSYDLETAHKQGKDEEKVSKEDDDDYSILRCSFCYEPGRAVSVPWNATYRPFLEELFSPPFAKVGWNSEQYDAPRVKVQMALNGDEFDGMTMWHILNSALPKGLGFVTPFYAPDVSMWKHLSDAEPALYNAYDADYALRCYLGIRRDLESTGLWQVYQRHVIDLNRALVYMSGQGVLRDEVLRQESEVKLQALLDEVELRMEEGIPKEVQKLQVYKKTPKKLEGLVQVEQLGKVKRCSICGLNNPLAPHFKAVSATKRKQGFDNICEDAVKVTTDELVTLWARPLDFKVSHKSLTSYQKALKHGAILDRKKGRTTFDEPALMKLIARYPKDPLYPNILRHRELQKLLSTYIGVVDLPSGRIRGGMPIGVDGRIHTSFTHNPSTLRLASQQPNLQNLPRPNPKDPEDLANIVRLLIVAGEGNLFLARDYSGIEAVLVGYEAAAPSYIRLAKMDVHSYYTSYALNVLDKRVLSADLPDIGWDDERLSARLKEIKKEFSWDRNQLYKHLVHAINYMQGAKGAQAKVFAETGIEFPLKDISTVMGVYKELFPEIPRWHRNVMNQAEKDGFLRNAWGYVHRFSKVYSYEKVGGKWEKHPGTDANKVIAFLPQSNAAGIIKESILRLFYERFEEAGQFMRLQVHDEVFAEVPEELVEQVDLILKEEMERPIPEMRLPSSYRMGDFLRIDTERKLGKRWGGMKG